jgi:hypothetical protein
MSVRHAHEDEVFQGGRAFPQCARAPRESAPEFAHGHVAAKAHLSRGAEGAAQGTADLGGQAQGVVSGHGNEHGLHALAVGQAQEQLDGAVAADADYVD